MFDFLGALANTLPGYQQGRQQAINNNWADLTKYNQVQAGQLQNAFDAVVFQPRVNMFGDSATQSRFNTLANAITLNENAAGSPGRIAKALVANQYAAANKAAEMKFMRKMYQQLGAGSMGGSIGGLSTALMLGGWYPYGTLM